MAIINHCFRIILLIVALMHTPVSANQLLYDQFALQKTDASCSLASVTMVVNAIQHSRGQPTWSQEAILTIVDDPEWAYDTRDGGDGISLEKLGHYLALALHAIDIPYTEIEVVHVHQDTPDDRQDFRDAITASHTFVLANFEDRLILPIDFYVGHISPVGGYDADTQRILLMDVDKSLEEMEGWSNGPHWVSEDLFFRAMHTLSSDLDANGDPQYRGYVILTL